MLCTDIQVKYSTLLEEGKSLGTSARQAIACGAGAIVVTGRVTGEPPTLADLHEAHIAADGCPLLIGSGLAPQNAGKLMPVADGAIVGTALNKNIYGGRGASDAGTRAKTDGCRPPAQASLKRIADQSSSIETSETPSRPMVRA